MRSFDWSNIRALNGSQQNSFEELCVQLARSEVNSQGEFTRKGTPDAGVECWASFPDQSEWGWQAKYFLSAMGDSQWQQIDKSVKSALESHPRLVRYYICVPKDRSDPRQPKKKSEMDRWNEHVTRVCHQLSQTTIAAR